MSMIVNVVFQHLLHLSSTPSKPASNLKPDNFYASKASNSLSKNLASAIIPMCDICKKDRRSSHSPKGKQKNVNCKTQGCYGGVHLKCNNLEQFTDEEIAAKGYTCVKCQFKN